MNYHFKKNQFDGVSDAALRSELHSALGHTAEAMKRVAFIISEMDRRKLKIVEIEQSQIRYMREIAAGRLLPQAYVRLAGNDSSLGMFCKLSHAEQERLLGVGVVEVKTQTSKVKVSITRVTQAQARQVVDPVRAIVKPAAAQEPRRSADPGNEPEFIRVRLTRREFRKLRSHADQVNMSVSDYVCDVLRRNRDI